jgi:hypothetical protein
VRFLESEITLHALNGIITLHSDDTSNGLYGFVSGAVLSEHLLEPALLAAEQFLPRNRNRVIDGFDAQARHHHRRLSGVLQSLPGHRTSPPFEITFETPQKSPLHLQVEAFNAALQTISGRVSLLDGHRPEHLNHAGGGIIWAKDFAAGFVLPRLSRPKWQRKNSTHSRASA